MAKYEKKCLVKKPLSMGGLVVIAAAAVGTMVYPQNAPVAAAVGGLAGLFVLKVVKV